MLNFDAVFAKNKYLISETQKVYKYHFYGQSLQLLIIANPICFFSKHTTHEKHMQIKIKIINEESQ